ncbi:MAG: HD-GYP domain-containing protein [Spirochaetaceae bacterium]
MTTIRTEDLKAGQRFDKPVFIDDSNVLVPENVPIREKDLLRLQKWNITEVTTEGRVIATDEEGPQDPFLQQALKTPETKEVIKTYNELRARLGAIHEQVRAQDPVDTTEIDGIIDKVLQTLDHHKPQVIEFILYGFQGQAGYVENALNCAFLSVLVGQHLNLPKHKLLHLATAALLHDIGMHRLPTRILNKEGKLSPEEAQLVRTHPIHSYKIITREMKYPEQVGLAALQHQERWDGEGYPKRIAGQNIILPARVIAVVDSFEAMVSNRPYRSSMIGYAAMRALLSDNARRFDPDVLKVFIRTMGIYPIGSIVLLNNGAIGRVLENNPEAPLKPRVKIMINEHGREYRNDEGEIIELSRDKRLFIAKAVDPKDIGDDRTTA